MHIKARDLAKSLPTKAGKHFITGFERGQLQVELYKPRRIDGQTPHDRDECYVVIEGEGDFVLSEERFRFGPGDFIHVPAGVTHRFEKFGESLTTWVIFYGPIGGEQ